mmetsp:Transcript_15831/g.29834  ORF Transcript_15831/g.29834 Transcript_15831/m.29834 type:complete len:316 (+) Transcript_15831:61-1008(+)
MAEAQAADSYLLYGKTGWIGGMLIKLLEEQGKTVHLGNARLHNRESLEKEIEDINPTHVLCAAGVTGRPNVDWCDLNKEATVRTNVIGALNIADICNEKNVHCTLYATGCIFEYDEAHPIGGPGFTEDEKPNFDGSFYSFTKGMVEQMLQIYSTLCVLRVRMPISDDLSPRNFVTKIASYEKVVDIPNSMTVLHDLLPVSLMLAERKLTGIYNFCNPGAISHNQVLALYKKHVDPEFTWTNFTVEEQDKILVAKRSNNELDCTKLVSALPDVTIPDIHAAMEACMIRMKANLEAEGVWPDNLPRKKQKPNPPADK